MLRREDKLAPAFSFIYKLTYPFTTKTTFVVVHCSVTESCLTPCDPMNCSTPGFPVFQKLPKFAQTLVPLVLNVIQPSLLCPHFSSCPQSFSAQGLFQCVESLH